MYNRMMFDAEPAGRRSALIAGDPRLVILQFVAIVVFTFIVRGTTGLLLVLSYVLLLHRMAGLSLRILIHHTATLMMFVVLAIGLNAVIVQGSPLPGPLSFLSREGLARGFFYGLRVLTVYYTVTVFLSVASQETVARGLGALLRPFSKSLAGRVALHGFLTTGFLPLFADEIDRVRVAQRFRGGGLQGGFTRKVTGIRLLFVPLVTSAIHRSGQLAMAVEIRGIRSSITRLLEIQKPGYRDLAVAAVTLALLVGASSIS